MFRRRLAGLHSSLNRLNNETPATTLYFGRALFRAFSVKYTTHSRDILTVEAVLAHPLLEDRWKKCSTEDIRVHPCGLAPK